MQDGRVIHIVWSPRRIPWALAALERLPYRTAYITGCTEHRGCELANQIIRETDADMYLLSYDDQVPTADQAARILEQAGPDIVSGWQVLGWDSPYGAASKPSWGLEYLALTPECFYTVEELRSAEELLPSHYFACLTAVPRQAMLDCPIWSLSSVVTGDALKIWPNPDGTNETYDKGCCSDWVLAIDLLKAGYKVWVDPTVEVLHLAPRHAIPEHRFWVADEPEGVWWDHRPRNAEEFKCLDPA